MNNSNKLCPNWRRPSVIIEKRNKLRDMARRCSNTVVLATGAILLCLSFFSERTLAQDTPLTRILFVFDASNSMNATWEKSSKISVARRLLSNAMDSLKGTSDMELALRVYGHQTPIREGQQDCDDTNLEVPFRPGNEDKIKHVINTVQPKGTTPIAHSLEKAGDDFPSCKDCRNIIILITDGIEACDGDPCAVSRALQKKGIVLKPFVIGIGLDEKFMETFECVGKYFDASDQKTFKKVLNVVITQALNNTTAQVNLLNINDRPKETNVPVTFYNRLSSEVRYNFIHTFNHYGRPDTLNIDPLPTYRVTAHTIPPVTNDSVALEPGEHNIIPLKTPQGQLELEIEGQRASGSSVSCIVRHRDSSRTLHVQHTGTKESYLVGNYDLEVLTLPRKLIKGVNIAQSHTTTVTIPQPGVVNIQFSVPGHGSIFQRTEAGELEKVCNIEEDVLKERITLQPGKYILVFRSKNSRQSFFTKEKTFKIREGRSTTLKL